jgi:hypothetical protein
MDVVTLADGTMVLPSDGDGGRYCGTVLWRSRDNGDSWSEITRFGWNANNFAKKESKSGWIAGIHAPFVVLKDGSYFAMGRGNDIEGQAPISVSVDRGKTWTYKASTFPPILSGQRTVIKRLAEGPIMIIWQTKKQEVEFSDAAANKHKTLGTFAALSFDEGQTWPVRKLIPNNIKTPYISDRGGYLSCVQTPDRIIHLISSSRYYRFNLEWVKTPMAAEIK